MPATPGATARLVARLRPELPAWLKRAAALHERPLTDCVTDRCL